MGRNRRFGWSRAFAGVLTAIALVSALAVPVAALPDEGAGGATLVGVIRDDVNGAPIDGALVCLHDLEGGICDQTDPTGGYSFGTVVAGDYTLWVTPPVGSDYLPVGGNPGTYIPVPEVPVSLVNGTQARDVRLIFGGRIAFTVTGANGLPAVGEPFAVCQTDDPGAAYACPVILPLGDTDANGQLTTHPIPVGEYRATVGYANGANGFPVTVSGIEVSPQTTSPVSVQLAAAGTLSGVVRDSSNAPVPGATVSIAVPPNAGTNSASTDANGQYSFPALAPGTYLGTVIAPSGGPYANQAIGPITITAGGATVADFTLLPASRITGTGATDGSFTADLGAVLICQGSATPNVTSPVTCSDTSPGEFAALYGPIGTTPVPFEWVAPSAGAYTIRLGYYSGSFPAFTGVMGSPAVTVNLAAGETVVCALIAGPSGSATCGGTPPPPPGVVAFTVDEPVGSGSYALAFCPAPGVPLLSGSCTNGATARFAFGIPAGGTGSIGLGAGTWNAVMAPPGLSSLSPVGSVLVVSGETTSCTFTLAAGPDCSTDDGDGVDEPPVGFPDFDGNGDGTPDAEQANVTSLLPAVGSQPVTIAAPDGTTLTGVSALPVPASPTPPGSATFPVGLLGFSVQLADGDTTADVEIHLPAGTNPNAYLKFQGGTWVDFTADTSISGDVVTLHLVDGGAGDADGVVNGIIEDPGGPAIADLVPPTVTCPSNVHFALNQAGAEITATVSDAGSGPETAVVSVPVATAAAGAGSVEVTGRDLAGNETTVSCGFTVDPAPGYSFQGFGWPVDNAKINVVRSGQQVPLTWRVTGPTGAGVPGPSTFGGITSSTVTCPAWPSDRVELTLPFAIAPSHIGAGIWLGTWKAPKAVPGRCVEMRLTLGDGSVHSAVFRVVS